MKELTKQLWNTIVYESGSDGKVIKTKEKGIELSQINEAETRKKIKALMDDLLERYDGNEIRFSLKESIASVKANYMQTHDGFRRAKGVKNEKLITVGEIYAFSTAVGYCFDFLPSDHVGSDTKIGIGVMAPAVQDQGKNLIKVCWETEGYKVVDLGKNVKPKEWIMTAEEQRLSVIGISCMVNKCVNNLRKTLEFLNDKRIDVGICVGGVAINKVVAYDLSSEFGIPIHYGHDMNEAESVLNKALARSLVQAPVVKQPKEIFLESDIIASADSLKTKVYELPLAEIVVDQHARAGCSSCEGDKKENCPLEIGYEKQQSLYDSMRFVRDFKYGILVETEQFDDSDRVIGKKVWDQLLRVEQYFASRNNDALSFRLPISCPFCPPKDCRLHDGECQFPAYYRPLHETYNINIAETIKGILGDYELTGFSSIILVK
jgi:methylmalonyl-CoA mutase cobalamin-binding subunit